MQVERVKAYLLGTISDDDAAELEQRYFDDPAFFRRIQQQEEQLIGNYLDDRLSLSEKRLFEDRYLQVPLLRAKFDQVKQARGRKASFGWPAVAAAAACCLLAFTLWVYRVQPDHKPVEVAQNEPARISATYNLTPGVQKGAGQGPIRVRFRKDERIRLLLEVPGVPAPVDCRVRLRRVGSGEQETVWQSASPIRSSSVKGGQQIEAILEGRILSPDDYLLEIESVTGELKETYVFRAAERTQ